MTFDFPILASIQVSLILVSILWMLWRNDEIPLLVSLLLGYISSYRYYAVVSGLDHWLRVPIVITQDDALHALSYIVVGQLVLLGTYMIYQRNEVPIGTEKDRFKSYFDWLRPKIILLGLLSLPTVVMARNSVIAQVQGGRSLGFQVSGYLNLLPMMLIGIALLIIMAWKYGGMSTWWSRISSVLILTGVTYLTYTPNSRFRFIGWIAAGGIILSSNYPAKKRLIYLATVAAIGLGLFGAAGATRGIRNFEDFNLRSAAWERVFIAEDASMLDGFVVFQKLHPRFLEFRWGMEHLEILLRPIPRSIWKDKPLGGIQYVFLGTIDQAAGTTVGFSPSLFGSFYAEGGLIGILFFSAVYGFVLAGIVRYSTKTVQPIGTLIRAIVVASLIPLLRGGDLPGIYAWIGMAFWPCFLVLWISINLVQRLSFGFGLSNKLALIQRLRKQRLLYSGGR